MKTKWYASVLERQGWLVLCCFAWEHHIERSSVMDLVRCRARWGLLLLCCACLLTNRANADEPVTLVFHVIAPTNGTPLENEVKQFFDRNSNAALGTYANATAVSGYPDNALPLADALRSVLSGAVSSLVPVQLGLVCVYRGKSDWQRIAVAGSGYGTGASDGYDVAREVNIPGERTLNVIVAPILLSREAVPGISSPFFESGGGRPPLTVNPIMAEVFVEGPGEARDRTNKKRGILASSYLFTRLPNDGAFTEGKFIVHEFGHWLDLQHPFDSSAGDASCPGESYQRVFINGQEFDHLQRGPRFGQRDSVWVSSPPARCGGPEPVTNYMSYTADSMRRSFNNRQIEIMKRELGELKTTASDEDMKCRAGGEEHRPSVRPNPPTGVSSQ